MLTELKALVHLLLWLFCFLVWKSTTHHQIIGIIFLTMYRLNTYHDTGLSTYFFMTFQSQLTLPHCANRHHIYLHIFITCSLFWNEWLHLIPSAGFSDCFSPALEQHYSSKRKWLLTTKHVSKLTHSLKLHYNTTILLLTHKLHHRPVTDPLYGLPDAPLHPDLGDAVRNALPWGSVSDSRTPSTCGQEVVGFKLPTL